MSEPACVEARELAPELALGVLDGADRVEMLAHLDVCTPCRAYVQELAAIGDDLARLAGEVEPPPGFGTRALARLGAEQRAMTHGRRAGGWAGRRTVALAAASAAAIAIAAGVVVVGVGDAERSVPVAAPELHTARMIGGGEYTVGRVTVVRSTPPQLAVSVDYAVPDASYSLMWRGPTGSTHRIGSIVVIGGHGDWSGGVEVAARDGGDVWDGRGPSWLGLVDAAGTLVCEAVLA